MCCWLCGCSRAHANVQDMADQLAAVNKERVQLQREFDAFKDLTAQVGPLAALH